MTELVTLKTPHEIIEMEFYTSYRDNLYLKTFVKNRQTGSCEEKYNPTIFYEPTPQDPDGNKTKKQILPQYRKFKSTLENKFHLIDEVKKIANIA